MNQIEFHERWISEGIGEGYKTWYDKKDAREKTGYPLSTPSIVMINSATGTGKSRFILDKLIPYAAENNRNILYLSNRTALCEQILSDTVQKYDDAYSDEGGIASCVYNDFGNRIFMMNYQSFDTYNLLSLSSLDPYYVIFDEAHFFIDDSAFNVRTHHTFKKLLRVYPNAALIFMTATAADFNDIFKYLVPKGINVHQQPEIYDAVSHKNIVYYKNTYRTKAYNLIAYDTAYDIINKINTCPKDEKWLIFVTRKRDGKDYKDKIERFTHKSVRLLTSDSKKSACWELLINEKRFKSDILITTKVIDSGISIHDSCVKHIVLPFCDETEFIQMIGRRRISDEHKQENKSICLYIEDISTRRINAKLNRLTSTLRQTDTIIYKDNINDKNYRKEKNESLKNKFLNTKKSYNGNLIQVDKYGNLTYNPFSYYKLSILHEFYTALKEQYKITPDFYFNYIKQWLGTTQPIKHIYCEECGDFNAFTAHFENVSIANEEAEQFYSAFEFYYKRACVKAFADDLDKLSAALKIRKGRDQRKATMNKSLTMLNLPYEIKKEKNCWVLKKIPDAKE